MPVVSAVTVCNSALLKIGADPISSLSGTDRASTVCRLLWQYLCDEVMSNRPWRFALKRVTLTPNGTTPVYGYQYTYDIPSDCLRLLVPDDNSINWTVEGSKILCSESSLNIRYLFRNTDPSSWDACFGEVMAWRMAMELALSLAQSIPLKQEAERSFKDAIAEASSINAVIGTIPALDADIWTKARKGYKWWRPTAGQDPPEAYG
jgi:hypothetical protein